MNNKIIIAIDAMGGERAPSKNIEGVFLFIKKNKKKKNFLFNLYGDEVLIKKELSLQSIDQQSFIKNKVKNLNK